MAERRKGNQQGLNSTGVSIGLTGIIVGVVHGCIVDSSAGSVHSRVEDHAVTGSIFTSHRGGLALC